MQQEAQLKYFRSTNLFQYSCSVAYTPVVDSIYPMNGSSLGNTTVTLVGQFNGLTQTCNYQTPTCNCSAQSIRII